MASLWINSRLVLSVISRTRSRTVNLNRSFWRSGSEQVWFHEKATTRKPRRQSSGHARCAFPRPRGGPLICTDWICNPVDGEACDGMRAGRSSFVPLIFSYLQLFLSLFHCIFVSLLTIFPLFPCGLGLVTSYSLCFMQLVSSQSLAI